MGKNHYTKGCSCIDCGILIVNGAKRCKPCVGKFYHKNNPNGGKISKGLLLAYSSGKFIPNQLGKPIPDEVKKKISASNIATKDLKPKSFKYKTIHAYLNNRYIKTGMCTLCRKKSPRTEWAKLKSRPYDRDIKSYQELCVKCHRNYDLKIRNEKKEQTKNKHTTT